MIPPLTPQENCGILISNEDSARRAVRYRRPIMNQQKKWIRRKPETMLDWMIIVFSAIAFYMVLN